MIIHSDQEKLSFTHTHTHTRIRARMHRHAWNKEMLQTDYAELKAQMFTEKH